MKLFKAKDDASENVVAFRGRGEAVSDDLLWRRDGDETIACCLVHRQRLVPRDPETGGLRNIAEARRIGEETPFGPWRLYCIGGAQRDEHPVDLSESSTWDEAVRRASVKLDSAADPGTLRRAS